MLYIKILLLLAAFIYLFALIFVMVKYKINLRLVVGNSLAGVVLLFALKLLSGYLNITIYINIISVLMSAVFGPVGIAAFYLIDYLFL